MLIFYWNAKAMTKALQDLISTFRPVHGVLGALLLALLATGCASRGAVDNAVLRTATWFAYVDGEDMKRRCAAGDGPRLRLVYNAIWGEQVATWDVFPSAAGDGGIVVFRRFAGGILGDLDFARLQGVLRGLGGVHERADLTPQRFRGLFAVADRTFAVPGLPAGSFLRSDSYYAVLATCTASGAVRYAAWSSDGVRLVDLPLLALLREGSRSAASLVDDRPLGLPPRPGDSAGRHRDGRGEGAVFVLQLGEGGLVR